MRSFDLKSVNPLKIDHWNDRIHSNEGGSIFHSRQWAEVLVKTYRYQPHYLISSETDRSFTLIPFMQVQGPFKKKIGVSLPFSDIVDPIIPKGVDKRPLFQKTIEYARNQHWTYLDFHGGEKYWGDSIPAREFCGHSMDLTHPIENLYKKCKASNRRNINNAASSNVEVQVNNSTEMLNQFYALHCLTRKRLQLPVQPYSFFRNIFEHIIAKGMGNVFYASLRGKVIAAAVFFHLCQKACFEFGVSDMQHQRLRANNLLIWEAVRLYATRGCKRIDFGRTNVEDIGLRRFKRSFGAQEHPVQYFRYDIKNNQFLRDNKDRLYMVIRLVYKWMPTQLSKVMSNLIYKHFG